jgi:uncharacterized protein involved in exopolysaccharide biosynthesis
MEDEEIELMDIINVLWKRKLLVIIGTLICMFIVGVISFLLKPVYEISTLIQPGKMLIEDASGRYEEVSIEKPSQVAKRISEKTYDNIIAFELKIPLKELPEIEAEEVKDTYLVRAWVKNHDIQRGKEVLNSLIKNLRKDIDEKVDAELKMIDAQIANLENKIKSLEISIQTKEIEKDRLNKDILSTKNKIKISEDRIKTLLDEMKVVKERMDRLEEEQRKALKEGTDDRSAISMLLYSNEIQNNLRYYNTLEDRLSSEKVNLENLKFSVNSKEQDIKQLNREIDTIKTEIETIKNQIYLLKEKKKRIDYTKVVKPPAPSLYPVFPKKKLNVLIAGILGGTLFSFLAFFLEYLEKRKEGNG